MSEHLQETTLAHTVHLEDAREVIKPAVLARWRSWGVPEERIRDIIRQRLNMATLKETEQYVTVPNYAYRMPRLPEIEAQRWGFAKMIDFEAHIDVKVRTGGRDKIKKIDRWTYKREYIAPRIELTTETYTLTEEIADMIHVTVGAVRVRYRGEYRIMYHCRAWTARAVRICYLTEPYLTVPEKKRRANQILDTYRETPSIRAV